MLYQLENSKGILARSAAVIEMVKVGKNEKTTAEDKAKIHAALRNIIVGNSYWRLRNRAITQLQILPGTHPLDEATIAALLTVINRKDKSWTRQAAIGFLGMTRNPKFADIYLSALSNPSDRVITTAAAALGKTKSPQAFETLAKLMLKPSMKSQSSLAAMNGLKELGEPRGFELAFKALSDPNLSRWRLSSMPPTWDYRDVAVATIVSLGKGEAVFPLIFERCKKSMAENDINGIFSNVMLITTLADPRGQEAFDLLKAKFKDDANAIIAVNQYETQFKEVIKKP